MVKPRRGARRARPRATRHRPFESLVAEALATIPEPFRAALDEVAIVIDDEPSPEQRRAEGLAPDETLYGLYEGVPRTEWGADWARSRTRSPSFGSPWKPTSRTPRSSPRRFG